MNDSRTTEGRAFIKMHGLRNHFVIVDARTEAFAPPVDEIVRICDVTVGVGADELIVMEPSSEGDVFMRIYNVDGREVEACGNATRCVAWLLLEEAGKDVVTIETLAGLLQCLRAGDLMVSASMGIPECETLHMPVVSGALSDPVGVNVGNPHAVFFVDDIDSIDIAADAPGVQANELFPNGVNVGVAQMLNADSMRLVVYERGVGLTMACGSGTCAAVSAAKARGLTRSSSIEVELPGGTATVEILDSGEAVMTGPVAFCYRGVL